MCIRDSCKECRNIYETMKSDCRNSSSEKQLASKSGDDKELFKKINKKLNKRTKTAVIAGIAAVIVVLGGAQLLFNTPLKNIPVEKVSAKMCIRDRCSSDTTFLFYCSMCFYLCLTLFFVHVQFSRCFEQLRCSVEIARFELATPCLQGRCSPN